MNKRMIKFLDYWKYFTAVSLAVLLFGFGSMYYWGHTYSIDFVGGTNLQYLFNKETSKREIESSLLSSKIQAVSIEKQEDGKSFLIRLPAISEQREVILRNTLEKDIGTKIVVIKTETVGPVIGGETLKKTGIAALIAVLGILLYIAYAFRNVNFAVAAIAALFHDVFIVIGLYSVVSHFFGAQLDSLFVTALLTTMSFSVHDTIVVFDQIRDYRKKFGSDLIEEHANQALTDTMVRSLNNSFTIIFMLLALVLLGGTTIRFFAVALLIGTIAGTYSSPFVATPIAVWLEKTKNSR